MPAAAATTAVARISGRGGSGVSGCTSVSENKALSRTISYLLLRAAPRFQRRGYLVLVHTRATHAAAAAAAATAAAAAAASAVAAAVSLLRVACCTQHVGIRWSWARKKESMCGCPQNLTAHRKAFSVRDPKTASDPKLERIFSLEGCCRRKRSGTR